MRQKTCEECGAPFVAKLYRQRRCPAHEVRGRESRSPTTRAQDAEYAAERRRVLVPGSACHWCGEPATTVDHLVPVSRGGGHAGNLVPCCRPCNNSRQARQPDLGAQRHRYPHTTGDGGRTDSAPSLASGRAVGPTPATGIRLA